ncbi:SDR family oxidoreductase [Skermania sp. ID1734]|uniref:SDR family oxidoreductase n=1 Tax=Skermania sp. ID1734 TaxID=2597516 RepID=UPI00163D9C0B|nr:SDR family oxidoreductase [Skermania sp. ID1734]
MPEKGDHVVVIGGTSGLGLDIARACTELGAHVTVAGRDITRARAAAADLGDLASHNSCDLTDFGSIERFFAGIDVVDHQILTALDRDFNSINDFRADDSASTMLMKTVGYAVAVHAALGKFSDRASVVLFSGLSMWIPMPGSTTISMANAGVIGLMNSLATQIAPVRVNAITPGVVVGTNAVDDADPVRAETYERLRQRTPGKRLPTPQDIVSATFALTDNPGINAANLVVDAGMHLA